MLNKVMLIGRLGADPESRSMPSGDAVANLRLATTERYKDRASGEWRESTEWHQVVFFGRLAEIAAEYLAKGAQVYVEGHLRTRSWERDGQTHYRTEVVGDVMRMLGGGSADGQKPRRTAGPQGGEGGGAGKPESAWDEDDTADAARDYAEASGGGHRSGRRGGQA